MNILHIFKCTERNDLINMETLKVSSKSNPNSVAGALANVFREKGSVEIQAIGAGALNQGYCDCKRICRTKWKEFSLYSRLY